jgi:hypothetical protein
MEGWGAEYCTDVMSSHALSPFSTFDTGPKGALDAAAGVLLYNGQVNANASAVQGPGTVG